MWVPSLDAYDDKRDFKKTPEPAGSLARSGATLRYVIQKHAASRLHYDLRLEMAGVYKSWAVPKGPSLDPQDKRLAVETEDHPIAYGSFEGTIPAGEYGGGTVMLWDSGTFQPEGDPVVGYAKGHLKFVLEGDKLHGGFHLVRTKNRSEKQKAWLLFKSKDGHARTGGAAETLSPTSVKTGRSLAEIEQTGAEQGSMPSVIAPALCKLVNAPPKGDGWIHEPKIDGYRVMIRKEGADVRLFTRNGLDWTDRFPQVAAAARALPVDNVILDGEIAMHDATGTVAFDALQRALSRERTSLGGNSKGMACYVFDCLFLEGQDLRPLPLLARKQVLLALLVEAVDKETLLPLSYDDGDGSLAYERAVKQHFEGIVSKRKDSSYPAGRTDDWQKVKATTRADFIVIGFVLSRTRPQQIGALLLASKTDDGLAFVGKVGTGFTEQDKQELFTRLKPHEREDPPLSPRPRVTGRVHWLTPSLVVEVAYGSVTSSGMLRHASYRGVRQDQDAQPVSGKGPTKESSAKEPAPPSPTRDKKTGAIEVAGVTVTNAGREIYGGGITKGMLAEYIAVVAPLMLPYVAYRPLSVVRCPGGSKGKCFFQKHISASMPPSVKSIVVPGGISSKDDDNVALAVDDAAGLVGLIQMGVLEIHPWGAAPKQPEVPDRIIFDLDPADGLGWSRVCDAARDVRGRLKRGGLVAFVKSTGGKGLHVEAPLTPGSATWDEVKAYARALAEQMATDAPENYTSNLRKDARTGRTFIDYLRNGRGATAIAPYSMRAQAPTVAVPLHWDEIDDFEPGSVTVLTLHERLAQQKTKPWARYLTTKQTLQ